MEVEVLVTARLVMVVEPRVARMFWPRIEPPVKVRPCEEARPPLETPPVKLEVAREFDKRVPPERVRPWEEASPPLETPPRKVEVPAPTLRTPAMELEAETVSTVNTAEGAAFKILKAATSLTKVWMVLEP